MRHDDSRLRAVMAGAEGSTRPSETEADEIVTLQRKLEARGAEIAQLQERLAQANADKINAQKAVVTGVKASKSHMAWLRSELAAVKRWQEKFEKKEEGEDEAAQSPPGTAEATQKPEDGVERQTDVLALQQNVRRLRHELARWKHQVETVEAKRPKQEDEIVGLKAELTHTLDILTSTRHAVKHHEVEQEFRASAGPTAPARDEVKGEVSLRGGGHGCVEAHAERLVRNTAEDRNVRLSAKAKRLTGVVAAQQLLVQRLEKQLQQEERQLGQKDEQLYYQHHRVSQLKTVVRKQSDAHVAKMLGVATEQPNRRKAPMDQNAGYPELGGSASAPSLPPI